MRFGLQLTSWAALAATIVPAILFSVGAVSQGSVKIIMLVATIVWFITTPLWMGRKG